MPTKQRTERLGLRIAPDELEMVNDLADADGVSASDVVRILVRRAHAERFGEKKPKRKK
jgi:uncharacterized protein (DUF1778 family)